jgi:hypothetical protein
MLSDTLSGAESLKELFAAERGAAGLMGLKGTGELTER